MSKRSREKAKQNALAYMKRQALYQPWSPEAMEAALLEDAEMQRVYRATVGSAAAAFRASTAA